MVSWPDYSACRRASRRCPLPRPPSSFLDSLEAPAAPAEEEDGAPWHDPAMPLPERMKLAEAKPLPRRLMAAMGQQDCGQCGYNCKDYADALFAKSEKRLNLCVPGGKDTARMLKDALSGARRRAGDAAGASGSGASQACAGLAARSLARQSGLRQLPLAPPAEQAGLGEGNLAHRYRSRRHRSRLCGRRQLRHVSRQ